MWPDSVPVLVAEDVSWQWASRDGSRDLMAWLDVTFDRGHKTLFTPELDEARAALTAVLSERLGKPVSSLWYFCEFASAHKRPAREWQAACWNEMLHRLGYAVPRGARADPGLTGKQK